jgi:DnaJ-class molecular chaperone
MANDYYKTLGVNKSATDSEIKSAYRKAALKWHPDKHKGEKDAEKKFKEINEAYEVLSDKQKRQQYDTFGSAGPGFGGGRSGGAGGFNGFQGGGFNFSFGGGGASDFADIFESFFGGGFRQNGPRRGRDIEATIQISFEDAVFGIEKELEVTKTHPESGERSKERVKIKVPAGIGNGSTIRVSGKGEEGLRGGARGNLYIHINVKPDERFARSGANIHSLTEISVPQAVLGTEIEVETIYSKEKIKVPAGTQDGQVFKIKGKGAPQMGGSGKGDHLVKVKIVVPKKLSKAEKELYQKLAEEAGEEVNKGGIFW